MSDTPLTVGVLQALLTKQTEQLNENLKKTEENLKNHTEAQIKEIRTDVDTIKEQIKEKDDQIKDIRRENEKQKRQRNLILHKIPESEKNGRDLKEIIINTLRSECKVDITNCIDSIFRIGKKSSGKTRPVLISLISFDQKMNILWSKKHHSSKLEITEDFPKDVSEERKRLSPMLMTLRELGYMNVHLKYDKLCVDGIECSEEKFNQLVQEKQPRNELLNTVNMSEADPLNTSMKRIRQIDEEEPKESVIENKKIKTTIIGSCPSKTHGNEKNPIKEALKRQVAMQSNIPIVPK